MAIAVKRSASAVWNGDVPGGSGQITTQSKVLDAPYSFGRRFGGDPGTNPEELIAAAHAGCFTMALSYALTQNGTPPTTVTTKAAVSIQQDDSGFTIPSIELETTATVPNITDAKFQEIAEGAKKGCPVSKALASVQITLKATLSS